MRIFFAALCLPPDPLEFVMSDKKPGAIRRLFQALWDTLNFTRRLVFNLLFLLLLVVFLAALFGGGASLKDRTALVIAPRGELVEQFSADPASRAFSKMFGEEQPETQLRDVLRAIEAAAKDARITSLVIRPDALGNAGFASLREVGQALTRFKESGKQVVAYADYMEQKQYFLAAHADEVYLHPAGALLIEGLSRYRSYYREGLQDKLGVDVHLFRVGEYKSAAEPYILDGPSPESRESDLFWLNDVWQRYLADIGALRKVDPATLQSDIDNFAERIKAAGGDLAALALQQKLVDQLTTQDEFRAIMIERGAKDEEEHTFRQVSLDDYLGFVDREKMPIDSRPQVAVVVAQGEIVDGDQPPGLVGGLSTAELVRDAREDKDVKALVLRVDSPGGGVFPSEQIRREVELTRASGKPVVVSMGDVAASGGYWISMNADEIWADESTITGSIGIFGLFMTIPDTLAKIGVRVDGVATTRIAGAFDPTRPLDPQVGEVIQSVIDQGYREFIGKVAAARESTPEAIDQVARGRVWSGAQAKERGLVDQLGGLKDAIASAAASAKLDADGFGVKYVEKELSPFEKFVVDATQNAMLRSALAEFAIAKSLLPPQVTRDLVSTLRLLQDPKRVRAVAFCFCEL
jgi:protease-4